MQRIMIGFSMFMLMAFGSLSAQTSDQQQSTNATASSASTGVSDNEFVRKAAEGSMAEVELGQLASEKAQNPEVKQFAQHMVTDHTQASEQLKQAAQGQNVPSSIGAEHQQVRDRLSNLSGSEFDREYMQAMVQDHEKALALFREQANSGQGELKSFASSMIPKLEEHQRMAQDIASKLGAGSSASAGEQSGTFSSSGSSTTSTDNSNMSPSSSAAASSTSSTPSDRARTDASSAQSSTSRDTSEPMVNNRTSEHGDDQSKSSDATSSTSSTDTSNTASSSPAATDSTSSSQSTEPSTQSSATSSTSTTDPSAQSSSATAGSSSVDNTSKSSDTGSRADLSSRDTNINQGASTDNGQLPRTASPLPLMGLLGLMSLGLGLFLNLRRRLN